MFYAGCGVTKSWTQLSEPLPSVCVDIGGLPGGHRGKGSAVAVIGLRYSAGSSLVAENGGSSLVAVQGLLTILASLFAAHQLYGLSSCNAPA